MSAVVPGGRVIVMVADGLGVGGAPDAASFATVGADTLGHVAAGVGGLHLPTLGRWGLGRLTAVAGVAPADHPEAVLARLVASSAGNDTPTGHWELMGRPTSAAPPTYPRGFPAEVLEAFAAAAGLETGAAVLGNCAENGEAILARLGAEHLRTGSPIVYTSGDSVFQVAAHVDVVPLERLYRWCAAARSVLVGAHPVRRVIARPFAGRPGGFVRLSDSRRDWAVSPPSPTACDLVVAAGVPVVAIGKIGDIFDHRGVSSECHPEGADGCFDAVAEQLGSHPGPALVFVNLAETDNRGHARDPEGFAAALEAIDAHLGRLAGWLGPGDVVALTADHGNDPTFMATTDHTRERVPLVVWGPGLHGGDLGELPMAALGAAVATRLGADAGALASPAPAALVGGAQPCGRRAAPPGAATIENRAPSGPTAGPSETSTA